MKIITSKITPFSAILSGTVRYDLSSEPVSVNDEDAEAIRVRWGNLVDITDASIEQTVDAIQTKSVEPEVTDAAAPAPEVPATTVEPSVTEDMLTVGTEPMVEPTLEPTITE